jgi:hypothetical protein
MKHRAVIVGAGRIGAGYQWGDLEYTHAGAYRALADRVEHVGFIEPDVERAQSAKLKWHVPVYEDIPTGLMALRPTIVSICVQPSEQYHVYKQLMDTVGLKGIWQEKPFSRPFELLDWPPIQVNYMRRADPFHQSLAYDWPGRRKLVVYGKVDIHTLCHFEDLAKWWKCDLDYREFSGPCAYVLREENLDGTSHDLFFDNGGFNVKSRTPAMAMKAMLGNLLDHVDGGVNLWSPAL